MSADNGIYILETSGPEFRVKHCQGIDQIYGEFNDDTSHWEMDHELVKEYFKDSKVFTDPDEALAFAVELSYNYAYLEYGIGFVSELKNLKFSEL